MFLSKFYIFNAREEEKKPSFTLIRKECHQNMLSVPVGTTQKSMSILWGIHPYILKLYLKMACPNSVLQSRYAISSGRLSLENDRDQIVIKV